MDFYEAFAHTWGSTGTVDDSLTATQYDQGWNFIGARPPRLGEFNKREKLIDQRLKWLYDQIKTAADAHGVTLNGSDVGGLLAILQYLIGDHASASDPHGQYQLESSMSAYATLASPNLTGVPTAPTAAPGTNTKQIANTKFVITEVTTAVSGMTIADASETVAGKIEIATSAEAIAGTDTARAITPAGLRSALNASGSAPVFACRAWVNFNGTGTVAIRGSGNVSSITDNGTGNYTVNFATAMPDTNYAVVCTTSENTNNPRVVGKTASTTSSVTIKAINNSLGALDCEFIDLAIFR